MFLMINEIQLERRKLDSKAFNNNDNFIVKYIIIINPIRTEPE